MDAMDTRDVLAALTDEPCSATTIYLRYAGLPEQKSLTHKHRKARRRLAASLEALAAQGLCQRAEGDSRGHLVPAYSRLGG